MENIMKHIRKYRDFYNNIKYRTNVFEWYPFKEDAKLLYVGDSATDIQAGKAANSITVAYISNMNKKNALLNEQPDYITDDLLEILQIIK